MNLAVAIARHSLVDVLGPPVVVEGDVEVAHVAGDVVGGADQVRVPVAARAGERIGARRRVVELGPGDGDEIGPADDVEVAVGAVVDIVVIEPDVVRAVGYGDRIGAAAAVRGTVGAVVPHDGEVSDDDVDGSRQFEMAVNPAPQSPTIVLLEPMPNDPFNVPVT